MDRPSRVAAEREAIRAALAEASALEDLGRPAAARGRREHAADLTVAHVLSMGDEVASARNALAASAVALFLRPDDTLGAQVAARLVASGRFGGTMEFELAAMVGALPPSPDLGAWADDPRVRRAAACNFLAPLARSRADRRKLFLLSADCIEAFVFDEVEDARARSVLATVAALNLRSAGAGLRFLALSKRMVDLGVAFDETRSRAVEPAAIARAQPTTDEERERQARFDALVTSRRYRGVQFLRERMFDLRRLCAGATAVGAWAIHRDPSARNLAVVASAAGVWAVAHAVVRRCQRWTGASLSRIHDDYGGPPRG